MQVKKFEARTMKEALEMVKSELGPDAIILQAKDNSGGFGLMSQNSVEVTAAVSEKTLKKRKIAMSRLREEQKEKFAEIPAKAQKKFIEDVIEKMSAEQAQKNRQITSTQYVDIADEEGAVDTPPAAPSRQQMIEAVSAQAGMQAPPPARAMVQQRYQQAPVANEPPAVAAELTAASVPAMVPAVNKAATEPMSQPTADTISLHQHLEEVASLKGEISRLKKAMKDFKKVPQTFISVHPGAEKGISYEFSFIYQKLSQVGVDDLAVSSLISQAQRELPADQQKNKNLVDAFIAKRILQSTKVCESPDSGRVHLFTGPSGQGKTSSLVKFASHLVVKKRKSVAILTADLFKVGAADQLKIFAQILNVPFATIRSAADWPYLLEELKAYDYLLVDFPGLSMTDMDQVSMACKLLPPRDVDQRVHLVVSATAKNDMTIEVGKRYQALGIQDVIFTGVDEAVHHGLIYNFQNQLQLPLHSFGIGTKIPEDFELASRERVLDLLFRLTRISREKGYECEQ